jgi:hypothetical protein
MKRFGPTIPITLAFVMLFAAVLSCNIGKAEEQTNLFSLYYAIEPTSLMDSLKHGEMAFTPVSQRPELLPVDQKVTVNWHQADYYIITLCMKEF